MYICCVLVILVVSSVAAKDLCCFPKQFGIHWNTSYVLKNTGKNNTVVNYIAATWADYEKRRMVVSDVEVMLPDQSKFKVIQDLNKNLTYYVDLDKKTCLKENFTVTPNRCLPDGPKVSDYYVGEPSKPLHISVYAVEMFGAEIDFSLYPTSNTNECSLLSAIAINQIEIALWSTRFYNFTLGISDPSEFDIPTYCHTKDDTQLRFHANMARKAMVPFL